jgi:hypothetical protein
MPVPSKKPAAAKTPPASARSAPGKSRKIPPFITGPVTVVFSNLKEPDSRFSRDKPTHNLTVVITPELQAKIDEILETSGADKVNGLKTSDGVETIKFKSSKSVEEGPSFPIVDAKNKPTNVYPYRGDVVRVRVSPFLTSVDGTLSFALSGVQLIDKKPYAGGFDEYEGGYEDGADTAPAAAASDESDVDEEIPF